MKNTPNKTMRRKQEDIVKGMKKNRDSFEAKYGDRAEEVMYATATKLAKKKQGLSEMNTKTLVGHILSKNMLGAQSAFSTIISSKVLSALSNRKAEIARGMFSETKDEWDANRKLNMVAPTSEEDGDDEEYKNDDIDVSPEIDDGTKNKGF